MGDGRESPAKGGRVDWKEIAVSFGKKIGERLATRLTAQVIIEALLHLVKLI